MYNIIIYSYKISIKLTFDLLIIALGEVEHSPGGTLRGLAESLPGGVFTDTHQNTAVTVGEFGQRLARLLLGPSTLASSCYTLTITFV